MTHYIVIRRGKKDHVIEGPYASFQIARLARERYFFTGYDDLCDKTPDRLTISYNNSFAISCCSIKSLPDWDKGSLRGVDLEDLPRVNAGKLF